MSWYNNLGDLFGDVKKAAPVAGLIPGVGGMIASGISHLPGGQAAENAIGSHIPGLQGVQDFLGGNGGGNALMAAQGVNAALLGKKSSDYADNAMGSVQQNWNERQPLRDAGMQGMLHPEAGIAPKLAAIPNRNPYSKPMPQTPQLAPV